jgi:hypothetical protein
VVFTHNGVECARVADTYLPQNPTVMYIGMTIIKSLGGTSSQAQIDALSFKIRAFGGIGQYF